jgi:uncharacterized protein
MAELAVIVPAAPPPRKTGPLAKAARFMATAPLPDAPTEAPNAEGETPATEVSGEPETPADTAVETSVRDAPPAMEESPPETSHVAPETVTTVATEVELETPLAEEKPVEAETPVAESVADSAAPEEAASEPEEPAPAKGPTLAERASQLDPVALASELEVGELLARDLLASLARPGRDPREDLPPPIFRTGIM